LHLTNQTESQPGAARMRIERLKKAFRTGKQELVLFENLSFEVQAGEMLAIVGESGSGKSTLLHILGALDKPTAGDVHFGNMQLGKLNEEAAADFRGSEIGFVWQFHYLLPEFTALENAAMPLLMKDSSGAKRKIALEKAAEWLRQVGLLERAEHRPGEMSGGEQQRVALARALITEPKMLMADEPTGDLDGKSAEMVFDLITRLHHEHGLTSLIVTHNMEFARRCDRVLRLAGGTLAPVPKNSLVDRSHS
jgi:lipoprotein-releasing system ATP-binding protein